MRLTAMAALVALVSLVFFEAPANATNRGFEGEAMSVAPPNRVVKDRQAAGGLALELINGSPATRPVATAAPAYWIALRARGSDCVAPARVSLRVDGTERYFGPVRAGRYEELEASLPSLARGVHSVSVQLADDFRELSGPSLGCQRSVRVDRVTVYAPFADDSFRNGPLPAGAPLDKRSGRMVASLSGQVRTFGTWVNTTTYSAPVYIVPQGQLAAEVHSPTREIAQQLDHAPLPSNARPADPPANPPPGRRGPYGDANLVLYQPSTDMLWEFFRLRRAGGSPQKPRWAADWGGRIDHVSSSPGYFTNHRAGLTFGASASRMSLFGGLQTIDELQAGRIDHAVDLVLPNVTQGSFVWPAQASDARGSARGPNPIPEGTRVRLPASLNVDALGLPPYTRTLAKAIQRYGAVVYDRGGLVAFKAQDPIPTHSDPYTKGIYGGMWPDNGGLFARFPWGRLQVVATSKAG